MTDLIDALVSQARLELDFCKTILAKEGLSVLTATVPDGNAGIERRYPHPDVYDPETGAQWFFHKHKNVECDDSAGHFHCFVRPEGPKEKIHHIVGIDITPAGDIRRFFTVNTWVVGDDWVDAETLIGYLPRFDVQMPTPSYLVNRWLTAAIRVYQSEIISVLRSRDDRRNGLIASRGSGIEGDRTIEELSSVVV